MIYQLESMYVLGVLSAFTNPWGVIANGGIKSTYGNDPFPARTRYMIMR